MPELTIDCVQWFPDAGVAAWAQICCDETAFHVRMRARERDIRAQEQGPVGTPCQDSCLEFFFCPVPGDDRYLNIEFSPTGCMFLGFGRGRADRMRLLPAEMTLDPVVEYTADGWQVTYLIPYALISVLFPGYMSVPGTTIRANCYKCGDLTSHPHYLLWHPSTSPHPDFHRSSDFGEMIIE